ncbi:nuclear transport factor 2 family protein [Novosphingobium profundi]|uniref:nuclear transport factor 2 family protein n=1 Tax=Novosphingobium profundi TaxID=1774954 RepID=UPI001CFE519C|nr:nuclear transport factor 2 family protein [Novosphingobium profundi]
MTDFEEIQNLKARYCQAADSSTQDREAAIARLMALFTPDVTADYGFGEMDEALGICTLLTDKIGGGSEWMVHNLHSPCIAVEGDTASADWTVNVRMKRRGSGQVDFVFGRYHDEFRRTDGVWRIRRVVFDRTE